MSPRRALAQAHRLLVEAEAVAEAKGLEREHASAVGLAHVRGWIAAAAMIIETTPWWLQWLLTPGVAQICDLARRHLADYTRIAARHR